MCDCNRRACGADGDASEAERRGGALFIERPLPLIYALLAQPSLALLSPWPRPPRRLSCRRMVFAFAYSVADVRSYHACAFVMASAAEKAVGPARSFAVARRPSCRRMVLLLHTWLPTCGIIVRGFIIWGYSVRMEVYCADVTPKLRRTLWNVRALRRSSST